MYRLHVFELFEITDVFMFGYSYEMCELYILQGCHLNHHILKSDDLPRLHLKRSVIRSQLHCQRLLDYVCDLDFEIMKLFS